MILLRITYSDNYGLKLELDTSVKSFPNVLKTTFKVVLGVLFLFLMFYAVLDIAHIMPLQADSGVVNSTRSDNTRSDTSVNAEHVNQTELFTPDVEELNGPAITLNNSNV